jgi:hypothetical protein
LPPPATAASLPQLPPCCRRRSATAAKLRRGHTTSNKAPPLRRRRRPTAVTATTLPPAPDVASGSIALERALEGRRPRLADESAKKAANMPRCHASCKHQLHRPQRCFQRRVVWYANCFSSDDLFGQ